MAKCSCVSFEKRGHIDNTSYAFDTIPLAKLIVVKDLGIQLDKSLSFSEHIDIISGKACKMLEFILRNYRDVSVPALKSVHCSLVRFVLEFSSIVWNPFYDVHRSKLERIKKIMLDIVHLD